MKSNSCKVTDIFHTSMGDIYVLKFTAHVIPKVGQLLENAAGDKWKIIGIVMKNRQPSNQKDSNDIRGKKMIWDCSLQPQEVNNSLLLMGTTLYMQGELKQN